MAPTAKKPTPLPKKPMLGILLLNSTPPFQINMIFPFIPWMVDDLRGTSVMSGFWCACRACPPTAALTPRPWPIPAARPMPLSTSESANPCGCCALTAP